jgi:hypothetical protein
MSYSTSNPDAFRLVGGYTGRILSGNKPTDLSAAWPVVAEAQQPPMGRLISSAGG